MQERFPHGQRDVYWPRARKAILEVLFHINWIVWTETLVVPVRASKPPPRSLSSTSPSSKPFQAAHSSRRSRLVALRHGPRRRLRRLRLYKVPRQSRSRLRCPLKNGGQPFDWLTEDLRRTQFTCRQVY